jgi:hypothetical protein
MPPAKTAGAAPQGDGARSKEFSRLSDIDDSVVDVAESVLSRAIRVKIDHVFYSARYTLVEIDGRGTDAKAIR